MIGSQTTLQDPKKPFLRNRLLIQGHFQAEKPKWFNLGYILAFVY